MLQPVCFTSLTLPCVYNDPLPVVTNEDASDDPSVVKGNVQEEDSNKTKTKK